MEFLIGIIGIIGIPYWNSLLEFLIEIVGIFGIPFGNSLVELIKLLEFVVIADSIETRTLFVATARTSITMVSNF